MPPFRAGNPMNRTFVISVMASFAASTILGVVAAALARDPTAA